MTGSPELVVIEETSRQGSGESAPRLDSRLDPPGAWPSSLIAGRSPQMREVLELARRIAPHNMPILLVGETGTGKELLAREIHRWSGRRGRIQDINCGSLPAGLVEALLFGHRQGAFTGAMRAAGGLIKAAGGGTLFLDELTSLPVEAQVNLLRVLEDGLVRPLGGSTQHHVNFRLIAAVQDDIWTRLDANQFRQDLYQRIAGMVLTLPPLRERPEDIVVIGHHFADIQDKVLDVRAEAVLMNYYWPGNVRELKHAMQRAGFLGKDSRLSGDDIAQAIELGTPSGGRDSRLTAERSYLLEICRAHDLHAQAAADAMQVSRTTFFRRLKAAGISLRRLRSSVSTISHGT